MSEIWRDIDGYEGLYQVSNLGNVLSLHPHRSKKEKPKIISHDNIHGYHRVELHANGNKTKFLVHRLVADMFLPNPDNKSEVNHKDGNKDNNTVDNLEWCTHRENMKHAYVNNLVNPHKALSARWGTKK